MVSQRAANEMTRCTAVALLLLATSTAAHSDAIVGQASIIDGDTLAIHDVRFRLWGIDAPESDQLCRNRDGGRYRCGQKAANDLDAFIGPRPVSCIEVDRDRYKPLPGPISRNGWLRTAWRSTLVERHTRYVMLAKVPIRLTIHLQILL
jgi:endonuclease YncB( thermonuclease family)